MTHKRTCQKDPAKDTPPACSALPPSDDASSVSSGANGPSASATNENDDLYCDVCDLRFKKPEVYLSENHVSVINELQSCFYLMSVSGLLS